jgi:hypothetical protein
MFLTEQQINHSVAEFYSLVESVVDENYDVDPSYEVSEEDLAIATVVMEYFIENYKHLSLTESYLASRSDDADSNEALLLALEELILDESIGSFIAGARHGIGNALNAAKEKFALHRFNRAKDKANSAADKERAQSRVARSAATNGGGVMDRVKSAFQSGKHKSMQATALKKRDKAGKAFVKYDDAVVKKSQGIKKSQDMANKIDNHVSNMKKRVSGFMQRAASGAAGVAGRVAGAVA